MTAWLPVIAGLIWLIAANLLGMVPSRDNHWRRAYALIAVGVPLLGWMTYSFEPWVALVFLAAGASVLRWPLVYLARWVRERLPE